MTVHELNAEELEELRQTYILELFDTYEKILEGVDTITIDDTKKYYEGIEFVKEDFFCNL